MPNGAHRLEQEHNLLWETEVDRRTAVLVGAEADVCVAHSAIGLQELGWGVVVVSDATFSPGEMHGLGLDQLRDAGIAVRHAKGV